MLSAWDGLVGSVALIAIIILALCVIVRVVKLEDVPRHLGVIVGIVILLVMLPAIIASLWNSMSFAQHMEIAALGVAIALFLSASRWSHNVRRR